MREYWFLDLEARTVTVWSLVGDRYAVLAPEADGRQGSAVLPGFSVDITRVFADAERQR